MSPTFVRPVGVMELWQWLGLLLTLVVAYAVGKLVNLFFYGVLRRCPWPGRSWFFLVVVPGVQPGGGIASG